MHSFILKRQPPSYNGWRKAPPAKKARYKADIETSFMQFNPAHITLTAELYGTLYYFFKKDRDSDADNLSKPLWDCLTGFLFNDDNQVKIRTSGTFDLSRNDFNVLDFSGLAGEVVTELLDAFDTEDHIVYVECGLLNNSMFKFNLE